jgi:hypothetical protein
MFSGSVTSGFGSESGSGFWNTTQPFHPPNKSLKYYQLLLDVLFKKNVLTIHENIFSRWNGGRINITYGTVPSIASGNFFKMSNLDPEGNKKNWFGSTTLFSMQYALCSTTTMLAVSTGMCTCAVPVRCWQYAIKSVQSGSMEGEGYQYR